MNYAGMLRMCWCWTRKLHAPLPRLLSNQNLTIATLSQYPGRTNRLSSVHPKLLKARYRPIPSHLANLTLIRKSLPWPPIIIAFNTIIASTTTLRRAQNPFNLHIFTLHSTVRTFNQLLSLCLASAAIIPSLAKIVYRSL
jgi:hypothetical protein